MKLGPVTKLDEKNTATPKKKLIMTSCPQLVTSLPFLQFMANLQPSGISDRGVGGGGKFTPPTPKKCTLIRVKY